MRYLFTGLQILTLTGILLLASACGQKSFDYTKGWSAHKLYNEARKERAKKNFDTAIKLYSLIEARFPYGRYAEQALIEQAYTHYLDKELALARSTVDRFLQLYPTHPSIDYVYYLKGLIDFHGTRTFFDRLLTGKSDLSDRDSKAAQRAFTSYKELVTRFPDSRYTPDARQRMVYLYNNLAKYEIHVARFYYIRGAYVAVVNRSKYVLQNFQRTASVEDALGFQAMAYKQMGMTTLVQVTLRVLKQNYPESHYINTIDKLVVTGGKPKKLRKRKRRSG